MGRGSVQAAFQKCQIRTVFRNKSWSTTIRRMNDHRNLKDTVSISGKCHPRMNKRAEGGKDYDLIKALYTSKHAVCGLVHLKTPSRPFSCGFVPLFCS